MTVPETRSRAARSSSWLSDEAARFTARKPRQAQFLRALVARQLAVCIALGAISGAWSASTLRLRDSELFAHAAKELLTSGGLHVFADEQLQVGPLHLLLLSPFSLLAAVTGLEDVAVTGAGAGIMLAAAVLTVCRLCGLHPLRSFGCTVSFLLLGPLAASAGYGHAEEVLVGLCLLSAGLLAASPRAAGIAPALCVGLATDLKLWGALGACTLLIDADWRTLGRRAVTFALVVSAAYVPFLLAGDVRTGEFAWRVSPVAPASLLLPVDSSFGWTERVLQGLIVLAVGTVVAFTSRNPGWMTPSSVVLARLATDPLAYSYYWTALITVTLIAVWRAELSANWLGCSMLLVPFVCALPFWSPSIALTFIGGSLLLLVISRCSAPSGAGNQPSSRGGGRFRTRDRRA